MENNLKLHLKLYYNFAGSSSWLKDEIIKKRYDSFRYFMSVEKKEEANIIIEIYSQDDNEIGNKYLNITLEKKILGIVGTKKIICKDLCLTNNECAKVYTFLKKTYFEKTK